MAEPIFSKAFIIFSNNFSHFCDLPLSYQENNYDTISLDNGNAIINQLILNTESTPNIIPEVVLLGIDKNKKEWQNNFTTFINNIREQDLYIKISIQIDLQNINEDKLIFYKNHQINLIININNDFNLEKIKLILKYRPLSIFKQHINPSNYEKIFEYYNLFNSIKIKNYDLLFDYYKFNNNFNQNIILSELNKIQNFIIQSFQNNTLPLIPKIYNLNFMKLIIKNEEEQNNIQIFNYLQLACFHCDSLAYKTVIFNQNKECFFCSCCLPFDENNIYKYGFINDNNNFIIQNENIIKLVYNIDQEKSFLLKPENSYNTCSSCEQKYLCSSGCYSLNKFYNNKGNISSEFYCFINKTIFESCNLIANKLSEEKNELFKNYFYGCSLKTLEGV